MNRQPPSASPPPPPDAGTERARLEAARRRQILELIDKIKASADKLARDGATRGDLKILSRVLVELRYAFKVFGPYRRRRKAAVFGSARTTPDHPAYQQAVRFARAMAEHGWMIVTGAAGGIMEAGHVGAGRDRSMGLNILLPFEQAANRVIAGDHKLVYMKYFFTRKLMFVKECSAVVCLPGGFGTLDEAMEVITLLQTGKRDMVPVVLLDAPGGRYWRALQTLIEEHLLGGGMISPDDLALYRITDDWRQACEELLGFFRVYHSMRYVGDQLVLRLNRPLSEAALRRLNERFGDIVEEGGIQQRGALEEERDEPELIGLPRLVLRFDRRSFGKLRRLIDEINRSGPAGPSAARSVSGG